MKTKLIFTFTLLASLGAEARDRISIQQHPVGKYLVISHDGYGNTNPQATFALKFFQILKTSRYASMSRTYSGISVYAKLPPPSATGVVISAKEHHLYGESSVEGYSVSIPISNLDSVEMIQQQSYITARLSGPVAIRLYAVLESIPASRDIPHKGYRVIQLHVGGQSSKSVDSIVCRIGEVYGRRNHCDINVQIDG